MAKMEDDIVGKHQPKSYNRCKDDMINCRKKNRVDLLFKESNKYHQNIKVALALFRIGYFGAKKASPPKIRYTFPSMMKLWKVKRYLKNSEKLYELCYTSP